MPVHSTATYEGYADRRNLTELCSSAIIYTQ